MDSFILVNTELSNTEDILYSKLPSLGKYSLFSTSLQQTF